MGNFNIEFSIEEELLVTVETEPYVCRKCGLKKLPIDFKRTYRQCRSCFNGSTRERKRLLKIPQECWRCKKTLPRRSFRRAYHICIECQDAIVNGFLERNPFSRGGVSRATNRWHLFQLRLRLSLIHRYGGQCVCCNESREEFLGIDHVNGGGSRHRAEIHKSGNTFYGWLRKNGDLESFRVLCHNCNLALGFYGRCPHQAKRASAGRRP